jgi:hypothetical protein
MGGLIPGMSRFVWQVGAVHLNLQDGCNSVSDACAKAVIAQ